MAFIVSYIGSISRLKALIFVLLSIAPVEGLTVQDPLPDLVRRIKPSVVSVVTYGVDNSPQTGASGFCISPGRILTNQHVVKGASRVEIHSANGNVYRVIEITSSDKEQDLAVLRVDASAIEIPPLPIARSIPKQGERVFVIGSPRGLEGTVSDGIISAFRIFKELGSLMQITAPISPGSSGSPVVNLRGEVIGVATAAVEGGQNLNFAIPASKIVALDPLAHVLPYVPKDSAGKVEDAKRRAAKRLYDQGRLFFERKLYTRALASNEKAIDVDPDFAEAWLAVGVIKFKQRKFKEVVLSLNHALQLDIKPERVGGVYFFLGYSYNELGLLPEAVDSLRQSLRFYPEVSEAHLILGRVYFAQDKHGAALVEYLEAIRLKPHKTNLDKAYFSLGLAYYDLKNYSDASRAFKEALQLKPNDIDTHYNLALCYLELGEKQLALREYELLRKLDAKKARELLEALVGK